MSKEECGAVTEGSSDVDAMIQSPTSTDFGSFNEAAAGTSLAGDDVVTQPQGQSTPRPFGSFNWGAESAVTPPRNPFATNFGQFNLEALSNISQEAARDFQPQSQDKVIDMFTPVRRVQR
ncbi:hypothetical protein BSKO_04396 [Bryopsis sp. KO-2023]|nr:hypothetical protein BSKO_04396 [Bryopsis sp. KO-2023]